MSPGYDRPAHLDFRRVIDAGCMSCHNGYPRAPVENDRGTGPRFGDAAARGHRLPALPWSGPGARRCRESRRPRSGPASDCEPRETRSRPPARIVHAVSPRVHEHAAAVSDSAIRASSVFVHAWEAAERLLHPFRSRTRSTGPRRQVRDRRRRVPPAQVGVLSAQRDDLPHVSQPARHRARLQSSRPLRRGLRELPQEPRIRAAHPV